MLQDYFTTWKISVPIDTRTTLQCSFLYHLKQISHILWLGSKPKSLQNIIHGKDFSTCEVVTRNFNSKGDLGCNISKKLEEFFNLSKKLFWF